jgi:hypothetical protein
MAAPTATEMRDKYLTAEQALLDGKEVSFGDRRLRMEDLPSIIAGRKEWEARVASEAAKTDRAPTLGGLEMKVANFNPAPHLGYPFNRN